MANVTEFKAYGTNTRSLIYDGYLTFNPPLNLVIDPEFSIVLGTGSSVDLTNGIITLLDGTANAAGTKQLKLRYDRIHPGTVKAVLPTTAAVKIVDVQTINTDYNYANMAGRSSLFVGHYDGRRNFPYQMDYIVEYPALAAYTAAQRTAELIKRINADPNAIVTASAITGASGSGSGVAGGGIRLTGKNAGEDFVVTPGDGFSSIVTVVQASAQEYGTSLFLSTYNVPAYTGAYTGKTFKTVLFSYDIPETLANFGHFKGNSVGNNAFAFQNILVSVAFEVGAGDANLALMDTLLQGATTPVTKYLAKSAALAFA